jgi:PAS domain S-box-containing protein
MNAKQDSDLVSLQKLVDSLPAFIFTNRPDGYLDYCNQRMLEYLGLPFEALEGWKWGAVVHSDDVPEVTARWQASLASGEPFECEARVRRADGAYRWMLHREVALRDESGQIIRWYGSSIDIDDRVTEHAQFEQERERFRRLEAELAHKNRVSMLGEMAASLAHELRQPIAAAMIDAKVCLRTLADNRVDVQAAREAASRLVKAATRADEIIKRTTALYKKDTTQHAPMHVNAVIREMAALLRQEASASSISIRTELGEGIPDIMADRVQLQQVFVNLMLNAIDAMKDTGGVLTITSHMSDEGALIIGVSDTGIGLPTENPDRIFESFVTTKPHGTGMGLAITRSIVESHGGRVWAVANAGPGATFLFTLPTSDARDACASQQP